MIAFAKTRNETAILHKRKAAVNCIKKYETLSIYSAFPDEPNSRILPLTVSLMASRAGPKYLRGSYISGFSAKTSRTRLADAIWFSVLTLIFAVPKEIAL